ncbi:hypothetical protein DL93DRAFT_2171024 [Clavulina sp. PMI_390]|nr:hypothetical protein DL93DRAFT_2171024 [Clavulina sp. PMI_390]
MLATKALHSSLAVDDSMSQLRNANWRILAVFLPPELLSDIFIRSVHMIGCCDIETLHAASKRCRQSFGSVCYRWREVVKATQALWAITSFPPPPSIVRNPARLGSLHLSPHTFQRCFIDLNLAGTAPLTLISRCNEYPTVFPEKVFPQLDNYLRTALSPLFSRSERILLEAPAQMPLMLLNSSSAQLAKVKSLEVRARGINPDLDAPPQVLNLSHAHAIQDLSLTFTRGWFLPSLAITSPVLADIAKLRTLTLTGFVDSIAAYEIISRASSLRSLVWSPADEIPRFHPPQDTIELPMLQHLKLEYDARCILPHVHAPELLVLNLMRVHRRTEASFPQPSQFMNLRALNLTGWLDRPFSPGLETFLHLHPSLELFNVQDTLYKSVAVACRTAPKLRTVVVDWYTSRIGRGYDEMLEGPRLLVQHWSDQVASENVDHNSHKLIFINEIARNYDTELGTRAEGLKEFFPHANCVDLQLAYQNVYALWKPEDWDRWLQQNDASYEPIF